MGDYDELGKCVGYKSAVILHGLTMEYFDSMTDPEKGFHGDVRIAAAHSMLEKFLKEGMEKEGLTEAPKPQEEPHQEVQTE